MADCSPSTHPRLAHQAVTRLPEDLLYQVFNWLALVDAPRPRVRRVPRPEHVQGKLMRFMTIYTTQLGWITASHVCRRWRELILRMPLLWARIAGGVFASHEICGVMIERAGDIGLHFWDWSEYRPGVVDVQRRTSLARVVTQLVPSHHARIERLALRITLVADTNVILGHTLTQLKHLYLDASVDVPYDDEYAFVAPNLQSLRMNCILLPFRAPILRSLRIDFENIDFPHSLSLVHGLLLSTPLLERLVLRNVYDLVPMSVLDPVSLPHLGYFVFSGEFEQLAPLWESVTLPSSTHVSAMITSRRSGLDLFSLLHERLVCPKKNTLRLSFHYDPDKNNMVFDMHLYAPSEGPMCEMGNGEQYPSGVHVGVCYTSLDIDDVEPSAFVTALVASLNPRDIRYLDLNLVIEQDNRNLCNPQALGEALRPLTDISTVSIGRENNAQHTKELLCSTSGTLFPELGCLVLKHPRDTIPKSQMVPGAAKRMRENWVSLDHLSSALLTRHHSLERIQVSAYSLEELNNNQEAWRAQKKWIAMARTWAHEVVIADVDVEIDTV